MKRGGGGQRGKVAGGAGGDHEVVHGASDGPVFGIGGGDMAVHGVEEVGGAEDGGREGMTMGSKSRRLSRSGGVGRIQQGERNPHQKRHAER